jgi:hypothetical protein
VSLTRRPSTGDTRAEADGGLDEEAVDRRCMHVEEADQRHSHVEEADRRCALRLMRRRGTRA